MIKIIGVSNHNKELLKSRALTIAAIFVIIAILAAVR